MAPTGSSMPRFSKKPTATITMDGGEDADDGGRPRIDEGARAP